MSAGLKGSMTHHHHHHRAMKETRAFVEPLLAGHRRVLDVGCGRGELAAALARAGHEVVALDVRLPEHRATAPGLTYLQEDFLRFDAEPFDALVFVGSLHHIAPLERAVEQAHRLLVPGGLLIADEFSIEAPDALTARWYYEVQGLLAAAGRYPPERLRGNASDEPLARWRAEHTHEGEPLSEGRQMREAIRRRFELLDVQERPYLYRYIGGGVAHACEPHVAEAITTWVSDAEQRGIAAGHLKPVGLRLVARR